MKYRTLLTIAAHPDDEILGCGGTMARFVEEGHSVHILILAEGLTSRQSVRNRDIQQEELSQLEINAKAASACIGVKHTELLNFPDNRMDKIELLDIIKVLEEKINYLKPDVIFTHFPGDLNIDHRITAEAVITATRPVPGQFVKEVYFFEVPSSTDYQFNASKESFFPNVFFQLTPLQMKKKLQALECYKGEMREFPHSRSIKNISSLAMVRGAAVGTEFAESFMIGRLIN